MFNGLKNEKDNLDFVIQISEPILIGELLNNCHDMIDRYLTTPVSDIFYVEGNSDDGYKLRSKLVNVTTSIFNDLSETIDFINHSTKENFFMLYNINKTVDKKVSIRYINMPLSYNLPEKKEKIQRLRDKKIEEILK